CIKGKLPAKKYYVHNIFSNFKKTENKADFNGNLEGKRVIDIGSGPTIYAIISASRCFEEIVLSDIADGNRREIEKWLKNEKGCFNWRPIIQFVCELEGRSRSPEEVERRLRKIVKQVLRCDVLLENPFHPLKVEPADCVLSSLCLEAACKDQGTYRRVLRSIAALLNPGGVLVLLGVLDQSYYREGKQTFSTLALSQSAIEEMLTDQGFTIKQVETLPATEKQKKSCDGNAFFYLFAQKK
ncbi:nicotinamide N-methyltransferase-like, partial [Conger conger]|uniref:nicotinamide N-methyltransferase-like n=1 Tax=Conger conger TaxID=82655 RepID=UPI002A5AE2F9